MLYLKTYFHKNIKTFKMNPKIEIKVPHTDEEILSCWEALSLLRPHLKLKEFVRQIKSMQEEGYTLLYVSDGTHTFSVAGYRVYSKLYCGKMLYLDDLSTLETSRGKGYASLLLNYLQEVAIKENCDSFHLDSGPTRTTAHKLYFNEGFTISSFHFSKKINL